MVDTGLTVTPGEGMTRIQVTCQHQSGLIYVVPAQQTWVCSEEMMPAHALAGFFQELTALEDSQVRELMRRWGIYYRQLPLDGEQQTIPGAQKTVETGLD